MYENCWTGFSTVVNGPIDILSNFKIGNGLSSMKVFERTAASEHYVGCFRDAVSDRDLFFEIASVYGESAEACFIAAMNAGYKYAGLQNGNECWAGDEFGKHGQVSDEACSTPC